MERKLGCPDDEVVTLINGSVDYYEDVQRLCDERFGTGYIDRAEYDHWMECPELFKVALVNDDFAGYVAIYPSDEDTVMKKLAMPREDIHDFSEGKPILYFKSAAVCKKYERRGLIFNLTAAILDEAHDMGYGSFFGSAWVYEGKAPLSRTVEKLGMKPLYKRKMLWYDDEKYRCVVCGGRCTCDAMIYRGKV